ncbi:MAG: hypothetical protein HYS27_08285 [Deltaproteobacteria bacterium]|nr:hypothetical protein [Deltaproteobacteria bacterium]
MVRRSLVSALVLLSTLACRPVIGACETDGDCPGTSLCVEGSCDDGLQDQGPPEDLDDPSAPPADAGQAADAGWLDDGRPGGGS